MSQAKYLGVDKDVVIESLKDGERFIRNLNIGAATNSILDEFNIAAAVKTLEAAKNDKDLAQAMRETGTPSLFTRMSDVFQHCAALDLQGRPHELYQKLASWGAFSGMEFADYRDCDYEQDLFMIKGFVNLSREKPSAVHVTVLSALLEHWKTVQYQGEDEEIETLREKLFGFINAKNTNWESELESFFQGLHIRERYQFKTMADIVSGIHELREKVESNWPLRRFGIVLENTSNNFKDMQDALAPIMDKVGEILEPYYELDEVDMTAVGAITRDFEYVGFVVDTSERVAQELANALPDWDVVDGQGNKIKPQSPQQVQQPKP